MPLLRNKMSFTLIECVLAMALCALVVTSLSGIMRSTNRSWELSLDKRKFMEDMRRQLFRMSSEIRYAEKLVTLTDNTIEFTTRYLEDTNDDIETIKYTWLGSPSRVLSRSVDGGTAVSMLDSGTLYSMQLTGYKIDSGDNLVPLNLGVDLIDDAAVVKIDLTFKFDVWAWEGTENMSVHTLVGLRNRQ